MVDTQHIFGKLMGLNMFLQSIYNLFAVTVGKLMVREMSK